MVYGFTLSGQCPSFISASSTSNALCSGEAITLTVLLSNPAGATVTWTSPSGQSTIATSINANPTNLSACAEIATYDYSIVCIADGSLITQGSIALTVYPSLNVFPITDGCIMSFQNPCPEWIITWQDGALTHVGSSYQPQYLTSGNVTYTINVPNLNNNNCASYSNSLFYDCINVCPNLDDLEIEGGNNNFCYGNVAHISVTVSNFSLANNDVIEWTYEDGTVVTGTDIYPELITADPCGGSFNIDFRIICGFTQNAVNSGGITLNVYPSLAAQSTISADLCQISVVPDCSENIVSWDDGITSQNSASYSAETASSGNVSFFISNPLYQAICGSNELIIPYDCPPLCPVIIDVIQLDDVLCDGDILSAQVIVDNPTLAKVEWLMPDNVVIEGFSIAYSVSNNADCPADQSISYTIYCLDDNSIMTTGTIDFTVLKTPFASLEQDNCTYSITTYCSEVSTLLYNGSTTIATNTYTAAPGTQGILTWTASLDYPDESCATISLGQAYSCPANCPDFISVEGLEQAYCIGNEINLSVELENPQWAEVLWQLPDGTEATSLSISHIAGTTNSCPETQEIELYVICAQSQQIIHIASYSFMVYPPPAYNFIQEECSTTIVPLCTNISTSYTMDGQYYSGNQAILTPGQDQDLIFHLTYTEFDCGIFDAPSHLHCPAPCTYDQDNILFTGQLEFCSEANEIDLQVFLSANSAHTGVWQASNPATIIDGYSATIHSAESGYHQFYYTLTPPDTDEPECEIVTDTLNIFIERPELINLLDAPTLCNYNTYGSSLNLDSLNINNIEGSWYINNVDAHNRLNGNTIDFNEYEAGYYNLYFNTEIDYNYCENQTVELELQVEECRNNLYLPNAFSPNGDGFNDVFKPLGTRINEYTMFIYDRWGQQVCADTKGLGWDGNYSNQKAPIGVYAYVGILVFDDGTTQPFKGNLTLIR